MKQHAINKGLLAKVVTGAAVMGMPLSALAAAMMPFIMGNAPSGDLSAATSATESALKGAGFDVVGNYSPANGTNVIVVTNDALKSLAGNSKNGGFGAMQRVAVTNASGSVQVSYTNPEYQFNAYRMKGDISGVQAAMAKALGNSKQFGAEKGMEADDIREYHYMFGMPYFDDEEELAEFGSYDEAVKAVEAGLAANRGGAKKVYRIDIPGKKMTVFGVGIAFKDGADNNIIAKIDDKANSHAAHFPYEILVADNEVMSLNGKFRIAINWPSLSMGQFMSIGNSPDAITTALQAVAKNKEPSAE